MNKVVEGIEHIGIAVHSIENTLPFYTNILGFKFMKVEEVPTEQVKVAFLSATNCKIELLEPLSDKSPIFKFLEKKGEGIHHIALKTNEINTRIQDMESKGVRMINQTAKPGAGGASVAFMHPKSAFGVLFELCEKRE